MIEARHFCPIHAACIALNGRAVLLCGNSGAGKTSLAYACAKKGWTYLSGDATYIVRNRPDRTVAGRPFSIRFRAEARELFPELSEFAPRGAPEGKAGSGDRHRRTRTDCRARKRSLCRGFPEPPSRPYRRRSRAISYNRSLFSMLQNYLLWRPSRPGRADAGPQRPHGTARCRTHLFRLRRSGKGTARNCHAHAVIAKQCGSLL